MTRYLLLGSVALCCLSLTDAAFAQAREKVKLRLGVIANSARSISSLAPLSHWAGAFSPARRSRCRWSALRGGQNQVEELDKGTVDLSHTATPYLFDAVLKGSNSVAIVGGLANPIYSLIARPDIKSYADLNGPNDRPVATGRYDLDRQPRCCWPKHGRQGAGASGSKELEARRPAPMPDQGRMRRGAARPARRHPVQRKGYTKLGDSLEVIPLLQFNVIAVRRAWAAANKDKVTRFARAFGNAYRFIADKANRDGGSKPSSRPHGAHRRCRPHDPGVLLPARPQRDAEAGRDRHGRADRGHQSRRQHRRTQAATAVSRPLRRLAIPQGRRLAMSFVVPAKAGRQTTVTRKRITAFHPDRTRDNRPAVAAIVRPALAAKLFLPLSRNRALRERGAEGRGHHATSRSREIGLRGARRRFAGSARRSGFAADYTMTVNRDRLVNAQNEPQNWLMMNGDYGSHALFQAHPDQPRQRQEPADGVGAGARRHAGRRPERSGERSQSADRQRLHVHDRRLGHDLQDRRAQSQTRASSSGSPIPACKHEGNAPRTRGIALWEDLVVANLPDGRVIAHQPRQRRDRLGQEGRRPNEFGSKEQFLTAPLVAEGKVIIAERRRRRRHARLGRGARRQDRQGAVALVRGAEAGRPGQRDLEGRAQRLEDRRRRDLADRLLRSGHQADDLGHRQSVSDLRSRSPARATTSTPTRPSRSTSRPASSPGISSTRRTTRGTSTRSASTCCTTRRSTA